MKRLIFLFIPLLPLLISAQRNGDTIAVFRIWGVETRVTVNKDSTKYLIGLNNVNNTSDVNKPLSTASINALAGKQASGNYASGVTNTGDNATNSQYSGLSGSKVSYTDTAGMLLAYKNGLNGKQASLGFTPYNATNPSGYISGLAWGGITGTLANQTDINNALGAKQNILLSGTNIKSINGVSVLGSGDLPITSVSGNAGTATALATPRTINGTNFDGTSNITITASAATLTGTLAASSFPALTGDITTSAGSLATAIGASKVTNTMLAGSIDLTTKVTGILPFANNAGTTAATSATTGTITVNLTTTIITCTPTGAMTLNGSGGVTGQRLTFVFTTSGVSSFVITFGTNFKSTGTLATGTTTAKIFAVSFLCTNGTQWVEQSRTAAQ